MSVTGGFLCGLLGQILASGHFGLQATDGGGAPSLPGGMPSAIQVCGQSFTFGGLW